MKEELTQHTADIEELNVVLSENSNKADQEVYGKAVKVNETVNKLMQQHLLKEDEDILSIQTHEDYLDSIKNAADYIKLNPPKIQKEPS